MLSEKVITVTRSPYTKRVTLITDTNVRPKAAVVYFHGGGLLYGSRADLPKLHKETLTRAGYAIWACDYPLAPACHLPEIMEAINESIAWYCEHGAEHLGHPLPYFLWGRSAGAYLALLAGAENDLPRFPAGIVSFYGYGFLCDNWFMMPSAHYKALPAVGEDCLENIPAEPHATGDLSTHYSVYVYARQQGLWKDLIYEGRDKFFYLNYTLRLKDTLMAPLFAVHSMGDPDVPYDEFTELCAKYNPTRFIVAGNEHDFDRNEGDPVTGTVLQKMTAFMDKCLA